jgi:putative tricarboxylic transport membrane protein
LNRIHQATSLAFLAAGAFLAYYGVRLRLVGALGPGPGFFPFWVGLALCGFSSVWLIQASLRPAEALPAGFVPPRPDILRVVAVIAALWLFTLVLRPVGFNLAMLALLAVLMFAYDRSHTVAKIVIAFAGSFGVHYVFERGLRVPLPYAENLYLQSLGF